MSAIDTMDHAHVANIKGMPVYWPLKEYDLSYLTDNSEDSSKPFNSYYLSLGGGSGEHPALIIHNDAVIFQLLRNLDNENLTESDSTLQYIYSLAESIEEKYYEGGVEEENVAYYMIDKNQWPLSTFFAWQNFLKPNEKYRDLEDEIAHLMALFIIQEMPLNYCLKDSEIISFAQLVKENFNEVVHKMLPEEFAKNVNQWIITQDNAKSGKVIVNNEVKWGYNLNDWKNDNRSLSSFLKMK